MQQLFTLFIKHIKAVIGDDAVPAKLYYSAHLIFKCLQTSVKFRPSLLQRNALSEYFGQAKMQEKAFNDMCVLKIVYMVHICRCDDIVMQRCVYVHIFAYKCTFYIRRRVGWNWFENCTRGKAPLSIRNNRNFLSYHSSSSSSSNTCRCWIARENTGRYI